MPHKMSCRESVYASWQEAVEYLPQAGILCLEAGMRLAADLAPVVAGAKAKGMEVATVSGGVNLDSEDSIKEYLAYLGAAQQCGVPMAFTSAGGTEKERDYYHGRLHELGQEAEKRGVVISLETHPPFCQNADQMFETVRGANSPNVKINLDTANIFYYNQGLDSADELDRIVEQVASLHLKDTDGGFESGNFPVFGQGVVRFRRVFDILDLAGFAGPLTIELEGPVVGGKDLPERQAVVVACMDYLKGLGAI